MKKAGEAIQSVAITKRVLTAIAVTLTNARCATSFLMETRWNRLGV